MAQPGIWNLDEVLQDNPLEDEPMKWVYLVEGDHSTINVVQGPSGNMPHVHKEHDETVYIIKGNGTFRLGDKIVPIKPGSVLFIPAGTIHTPMTDGYQAALSIYSPEFDPENPDREFVQE